MRGGGPAGAGGAASAKSVQQHLTVHLRTAEGFDTSAPLLNPNMTSESSAWMRWAGHTRGWWAVPEDDLRWVVRYRRKMEGGGTVIGISRDVPTFMLWGSPAVDHWMAHNATDEDRVTLHRGAPHFLWVGSIMRLRERAAKAADRGRAPGLTTDECLAEDSDPAPCTAEGLTIAALT
eukprot:gene5166-23273_t